MKLRVPRRIKLWERLWASSILIYTFVATYFVWKTMSKYGVNWFIFFLLDAVTSWSYGISTARIVVALIEKNRSALSKWVWVAGISFIAPQLYIIAVARRVPHNDYVTIAIIIGALALFALFSLGSELRKARSLRHR